MATPLSTAALQNASISLALRERAPKEQAALRIGMRYRRMEILINLANHQ